MTVRRMVLFVVGAALVVIAAIALTSCGSDDETTTGTSSPAAGGGGNDRPAAAGDQDRPVRDPGQAAVRGEGQGALPGLQDPLQQRRPGRAKQQSQAEAALTNGADVLVLDPVDFASAGRHRPAGQGRRTSRSSATTGSSPTPTSTTTSPSTTRRSASCRARRCSEKLDGERRQRRHHRDDQRRAHRQQRQALQGRSAQRARRRRLKIGAEYDTPDWSPDKAQTEMDQAITTLGKDGFVGRPTPPTTAPPAARSPR